MLLSPSLYFRDGLHKGAHWGSFLAVRRCHQIQLIWWGRLFPFPEVISCTGELQASRCIPGLFSRSDGTSANCLWTWIHLYLPLQPVNDYLALQDLSSAHKELIWILTILKTNSCWRLIVNLLTLRSRAEGGSEGVWEKRGREWEEMDGESKMREGRSGAERGSKERGIEGVSRGRK